MLAIVSRGSWTGTVKPEWLTVIAVVSDVSYTFVKYKFQRTYDAIVAD
jgi:hypothetical protein